MGRAPIARSSRYIYCIPPHTHALLRFRVHSVTPAHVAYFEASGVTVDSETAGELGPASAGEGGPIRLVPQAMIDVKRTWEGAPPGEAVYYSSVESYRRLHEMALARYGLHWSPAEIWSQDESGGDWPSAAAPETAPAGPPDRVSAAELDRLRRAMMEAHPDHGGTAEAFEKAHDAFEAARRQRDAES